MAEQTGFWQPLGRVDPVAPVPSLLTTARPLPAVRIAQAYAAAVAALKDGSDPRPHLAAMEEGLVRLGDDEIHTGTGVFRLRAEEARDAIRLALLDPEPRQAGAVADAALTGDDMFRLVDQTWRTGITWNTLACQKSYPEVRCATYDGVTTKRVDPSEEGTAVHADPFLVYTPLACDWASRGTRLADDATALTDVHTAYAMGQALWLGVGMHADSSIPTLRRNAVDVTGGSAVTVDVGAAILLSQYEQATFGSGGAVLHVPSVLMVGAEGGIPGGGRIATRVADYYRGPLGSLVSPGPGYPHGASTQGANGNGPLISGTADSGAGTNTEVYAGNNLNEAWMFVSGPIEYALGPIVVLPTEDWQRRYGPAGSGGRTNQYEVWAQRMAIMRYDPCAIFGVKVQNYAGSVS